MVNSRKTRKLFLRQKDGLTQGQVLMVYWSFCLGLILVAPPFVDQKNAAGRSPLPLGLKGL